MRNLRVAVVGAGPAGIYAADILTKSQTPVTVDLIERLPAPFGLVRYGVAPDHPRIKEIVKALHRVFENPAIRLLGNVEYGRDIKLDDLRACYDAVIFSTGADSDRALDIPGIALPGSFGAADFVSWYDGHPDVPRTWPLTARDVAVIGAGNVALDVARILAKTGEELGSTEIPDNVRQCLDANQATDVHVFARRGPAHLKFTPLELRELIHSPNVDVVVHPEGFDVDEHGQAAIRASKQTKQVVDILQNWVVRDEAPTKPHRIHLHFMQQPVEVLGDDAVSGLRTERTELDADGAVVGTGEYTDWPVGAVYRAVGYLGSALTDLPFDQRAGVVPNEAGRILDLDGEPMPGLYATGWIKRDPVGLIGHTKSDASETVRCLLADAEALTRPADSDPDSLTRYLAGRGVEFTTWQGWQLLDAHELALGEVEGRLRVKLVPRGDMLRVSRQS
ncbi:MAG: pyridine nucleotide-disulfide oxidoreductase [Streptosporangiales bacterium]|nr:pyridine nucleotide-disulfide oxidoreductase [Streptosporangiales bacterium]